MAHPIQLGGIAAVLGFLVVGCKASDDGRQFDEGTGGVGGAPGSGAAPLGGSAGQIDIGQGASSTGASPDCNAGTPDFDGDGFTTADGDCNDCDANVNPGAIEVIVTEPQGDAGIPPPADEDCDMMIDNVAPPDCDDGLALTDPDPFNGARAIELCQKATDADKKWGVLDAKYVRADGQGAPPSAQFGIMETFGTMVNVQGGKRMLVLSSGAARTPGQPGACDTYMCYAGGFGTAPAGFPQNVAGCDPDSGINDDIGLEVRIRTPKNATGYKFAFKFYSFEYEEYVCTPYNDQFIALVTPPPAGSINGNVSFDMNSNPVSVNLAFFDVCDPAQIGTFALYSTVPPPPPNPYCPSGVAELQGTGFGGEWDDGFGDGDAGATSWLQTQAPVAQGGEEITIRFAIWDTSDEVWDSTVLIDKFEWIASGGVVLGTEPIPVPK